MTDASNPRNPVDVLGLLATLLNAPRTLTGLIRILEELKQVWALYKEIAEPGQRKRVNEISDTIDNVLGGQIDLSGYDEIHKVPKTEDTIENVPGADLRKTMKSYYGPNPLYSLFWHGCDMPAYVPQYRALLASILPALVELEQSKNDDKLIADLSINVCRALRQMSQHDAEPVEKVLLASLSVKPLTPKDLLARIQELLERRGYAQREAHGHRIHFVLRALSWHEDRVISRPGGMIRRSTHYLGRSAPRHGGTGTFAKERAEPGRITLSQGTEVEKTTYWNEHPDDSADAGYTEIDPPDDAAARGDLVDFPMPAWTQETRQARSTVMRAKYLAQAIEMDAQNLPVTRTTLTGWDLKNLFRATDNLAEKEWKDIPAADRPHVAAWIAGMYYLGREADELAGLKVGKGEPGRGIEINLASATIWLPARSPKHEQVKEGKDKLLSTSAGFELGAPARLVARLKPLKTRYGKPFAKSYEADASRLLKWLNVSSGTHLTPARVRGHIANQLRQLAPSDETYAIYFRGLLPNRHIPSIYTCVPVERLEEIYRQAVEHGEILSGAPPTMQTATLPTLITEEGNFVGSRYSPRLKVVKELVESLYDEIETLRGDPRSVEHKHNAFTALLVFAVMALTGIRGTRGSLALRIAIDWKTGVAFISEKDDDRYVNARWVVIPRFILDMVEAYAKHEVQIRRFLALRNPGAVAMLDRRDDISLLSPRAAPKRTQDLEEISKGCTFLYFLGANATPLPVTRETLKERLSPRWVLHLGVLRHFVRTQLLLRCVSGELIDAQLGHFTRGQNAWSRFATLPPPAWREAIGRHLAALTKALGVRAIESPLFP